MATSGGTDLWWFAGFLAVFFFLWIVGGGPQRARENGSGSIRLGDTPSKVIETNQSEQEIPPSNSSGPRQVGDGKIIY